MSSTADIASLVYARARDQQDPLASLRGEFHIPASANTQSGKCIYLCGNSLGLQPKNASPYVQEVLDDWSKLGVEGHFRAKHPWMPYHEFVTQPLAQVVGAKDLEVVAMNSLTVNLHLLLISFYRPDSERYKIMMEADAFPSDTYALDSQVQFHGFNPQNSIIKLKPRPGEPCLRTDDILEAIEREGKHLALIMMGGVNYLTGQAFDMQKISEAGHRVGAQVGFDLAHAAGNLHLKLHDWNVDFACWCSYKYLNSGPGGIAGIFIHEKHARNWEGPRLAGWWGHNKSTRFKMPAHFEAIGGAEAWQMSNPPIFQLAALRASLELFQKAGMKKLREKSVELTGYLEHLLKDIKGLEVISPSDKESRGCQLSLRIKNSADLHQKLLDSGAIVDFREPDVIRVAPTPLYNSFEDVYLFWEMLNHHANT